MNTDESITRDRVYGKRFPVYYRFLPGEKSIAVWGKGKNEVPRERPNKFSFAKVFDNAKGGNGSGFWEHVAAEILEEFHIMLIVNTN